VLARVPDDRWAEAGHHAQTGMTAAEQTITLLGMKQHCLRIWLHTCGLPAIGGTA
jgi:hypothetical protein